MNRTATTPNTIPWRIAYMFQSLRSAMAYTDATMTTYNDRTDATDPVASEVTPDGGVSFQTGIMFRVNAGRRFWKMIISLEPSDTYTVRLWSYDRKTLRGTVLDEMENVTVDVLQRVVESMYDRAVKKYMNGFIPL